MRGNGSFVLHHNASAHADAGSALSWTVLPGSGTDELRELCGGSQIIAGADGGHRHVLEYELP